MVALVSLLGSASAILKSVAAEKIFLCFILLLGVIAVGGIVYGVILLLREIRMVINLMQRRIYEIRQNLEKE